MQTYFVCREWAINFVNLGGTAEMLSLCPKIRTGAFLLYSEGLHYGNYSMAGYFVWKNNHAGQEKIIKQLKILKEIIS